MKKELSDFLPVFGAFRTSKRHKEEEELDFEKALNYEIGKGEYVRNNCKRLGYLGIVCFAQVGYAYGIGRLLSMPLE